MKKNVTITIARQYGSGGRTVGKMLAKDLGINYYNKELLRLASEESGINEDLFLDADERCRTIGFFKMPANVYTGEILGPDSKDFTSFDNLFNFQAATIKKIAEKAYWMQNETWVTRRTPKPIEDAHPHYHYVYGFGDKGLDVSVQYGVTIAYNDLKDEKAAFHLRYLYTGSDVELL